MMTREQHRALAERLLADERSHPNDQQTALMTAAIAHLLAAQTTEVILEPATLESTKTQPTWAGVAVLVVVAAFLLALAWVIFQ